MGNTHVTIQVTASVTAARTRELRPYQLNQCWQRRGWVLQPCWGELSSVDAPESLPTHINEEKNATGE